MRFQPFIALALVISGVFAGPVAAQEDERFYGDWWPYSGGTGNNLLSLEPGGIISFIPPTGETTVERYVVIRDFGKRVVVRLWSLAEHPVEQQNDTLVVLELDDSFDPEIIDRLYLRHYFLRYYYCSGPSVDRFFPVIRVSMKSGGASWNGRQYLIRLIRGGNVVFGRARLKAKAGVGWSGPDSRPLRASLFLLSVSVFRQA
ncbi:MAG: hypothetical protein IID51_03610 [Proteobacteria bacterium]|nr:hypothetical protein [Pseudomonadota bacterium]